MKKIISLIIAICLWLTSTFAAYQPSMAEEKKVIAAWNVLLQIVDMKHNGNYDLLLGILKSFESKVATDERKVWILDTLISLTMDKMWMMNNDDDHSNDDMMIDLTMLENVVWTATIRWISYTWNEKGSASNTTKENGNHIYAEFENLPDAWTDNFYEGWIVRMNGWLNVLSTWELEIKDGKHVNDRMSTTDISDHTFYVLTLEPNDNDPAPADHILEAHVR